MKVSRRIYLPVIPGILGVLLVAGLAYWGQYGHTVPHTLLWVAAVTTLVSLVVSWLNVRYIAQRIERLAPPGVPDGGGSGLRSMASVLVPPQISRRPDELDAIEGVVDKLSSAVAAAEAGITERERRFEARSQEYAMLLDNVSSAAAKRIEEVRLPLHILLENRFGDLNENQEEMLGAARVAAEAADADLVALRQIAELDLGKRQLRRDRFLTADLIRALRPMLEATATHGGHLLKVDLDPLAPAIRGDRPVLQEALATLIGGAMRDAEAGADLMLTVAKAGDGVEIALAGAQRRPASVKSLLAVREITASGGQVRWDAGALVIAFRAAAAAAPPS
jgi:signal transduction histidine kinase